MTNEPEPIAVRRRTAARMLDCGETKIYELQKAGELETIKIGADDRIVVASIYRYVAKQFASAKPASPGKGEK